MRAARGLTGVYAALAAVDTLLASRGADRRRWATKPLLMPVLAAGLAASERDDPAARWVLAAQGLSWGGDVALMAPGRRAFLPGLGSFLGAHLAYVAAFRTRASVSLLGSGRRRAALAGGAALAGALGLAARRSEPRLGGPVAAYGLVLTTMAVASAAAAGRDGSLRVPAGAALFLLSDTLLGVGEFLVDERPPALDAAVMATYAAGQWCIASGMVRPA